MPDRSPTTKITGAEYAERLLAVNSPTRLIDHLIEKLAAKTGTGWESNLLEFKGSYHKCPDSNDPDPQDYFEWNVMHAFISLANAQGGCVVIGIAETDDHRLVPGDWDPDGILGCRDADGDGKPIPGREEKDLVGHVYGIFFKDKFKRNGRIYKFSTQNKRNLSAPPVTHEFTLDAETLTKLSKLVTFYPCHSESCSCNALAAIVHPVKKDDDLIEVLRKEKALSEHVVFFRDITAKTCELTKHRDIRHYEENREPASTDYLAELKGPLSCSVETSITYSTMRSCDPNFVGRQNEIDAIRKLCTGGKIVLIHAPGGTGKTELALKFAAEDAAQYPGGSFYVPAEMTKTWSDVLRNLLDWKTSTTGVTPEEWLGLVSSGGQVQQQSAPQKENNQDKSKAKPIHDDADIANALTRKSLEAGPILMLLDNVETPDNLLSTRAIKQVFPLGLPQGLHLIATARSRKGVTDRICCETTTLSLDDISTEDALAIINGANEFESDDEKEAAHKIIDILDHRALYVARIANLKNDFTERPFSRLLKKLLHDKLEVVKPTSDGDDLRTPAVLWQWVKDKLSETPEGQKDILTLQALALFPPDGISQFLLEALWYADFGDIHGNDILFAYKEDPYLFEDTLKRLAAYNIIQQDESSGTLRIHRLDRAAIAENLSHADHGQLDKIGLALHDSPSVSPETWIWLAQCHSPLTNHCCWKLLRGNALADILAVQPERAAAIPDWPDRLNGHDWARLLTAQPQFRSKLTDFSVLDTDDWNNLIRGQPSFIADPHCPKADLSPQSILEAHPDLLPWFDMGTFHGGDWGALLKHRPKLASQCPLSSFNHEDWFNLLLVNPAYADFAPAEFWTGLYHEIGLLLDRQPVLLEKCMTYVKAGELTLPTQIWPYIIDLHPEYEYLCPFDEFDPDNWATFLSLRPDWIKKIPNPMACVCDTGCLSQLLSEQPQLAAYFPHTYVAIAQEDGDIQARLGTLDLLHLKDNQLDNLVSWGDHYHAHQLLMRLPSLRYLCKFSKMPFEQHEIADILNCQPQLKSFLVP